MAQKSPESEPFIFATPSKVCATDVQIFLVFTHGGPSMSDIDKLGSFYLGRIVDPKTGKRNDTPLMYPSKNLTTHAVCIGMTGSGKTGLGIDLIEEASLDGIPSIVIDPKGDMGNLLLTFPSLEGKDFLPWIELTDAAQKGMEPVPYSEYMAKTWKDGLEHWGEKPDRIKKFEDSIVSAIYTPASQAGVPLSIINSFAAPPKEFIDDVQAMREKVLSTTSGLLSLVGIEADPVKSREHILISTIFDTAWRAGKDLDLPTLIMEIQKPSFQKIGVLDLDTFFPKKDRQNLSISLNNLLASPGFHAWMEGEPLNIQNLFYTADGKPKLSVIAISHLNDGERMFFLTLLLNELIVWMRRQPGTSSLRCLFYMDEIFGFFPPTATPPSKLPMLTLLKQARAFGLGIILATQNPVDLDYKGLANCGTWFIGKLQTDRDRAKVLEALKGSAKSDDDKNRLDALLAATGKRIFLLHSIYEEHPTLFETRWTMSFLKGPLTQSQIILLAKEHQWKGREEKEEKQPARAQTMPKVASAQKALIPPDIAEYFIHVASETPTTQYKPLIAGIGKVHFIDAKNNVDVWRDICLTASPNADGSDVLWSAGENVPELVQHMDKTAPSAGAFEDVPAGLLQVKNYKDFEKSLALALYQNQTFNTFKAAGTSLTSKPDETESEFRARASLEIMGKRDDIISKIREKYRTKRDSLTNKIRQFEQKVEIGKNQSFMQKTQTYMSIGASLLGTLFGKRITKRIHKPSWFIDAKGYNARQRRCRGATHRRKLANQPATTR